MSGTPAARGTSGCAGQLGNARGVFSSEDTAELPEQIAKPWRVGGGAGHATTREGGRRRGGVGERARSSPRVPRRRVAAAAAYGSVVAEARRVRLPRRRPRHRSAPRGRAHHEWLGEYVRRPRAVEAAGARLPRPPRVRQARRPTKAIWYKPGQRPVDGGLAREGYASDGCSLSSRRALVLRRRLRARSRGVGLARVVGAADRLGAGPALRCVSGAEGDGGRRARGGGVHKSASSTVGRARRAAERVPRRVRAQGRLRRPPPLRAQGGTGQGALVRADGRVAHRADGAPRARRPLEGRPLGL